jgi:HAD superfamily hydrolase (TIGR01509 family)
MLAGIIFDFDGVIVDSHPLHLQAWKGFLRSIGKDVSDADLAFVLEGAKREEILRHFLGDLTNEQINIHGAEKERRFQTLAGELKLVNGVADFLAQVDAAGLPMAVATSGSRGRAEQTLESFNLRSHFRAITTGDDVARGKPDPALFLLAARSLRVDAESVLVCEDAVSGVVAAKSAGMKCLAIAANSRGPRLKQAGADLVMDDFTKVRLDDLIRLFVQG